MLLLSRYIRLVMCFLLLFVMSAWANPPKDTSKPDEICFFYKYMNGTNDYSDPANQVIHFIKNRWIELENDLARGHGEELKYLSGLAKCPYHLPEMFWHTHLKGLPYKERAKAFTDIFMTNCFCNWE